MKRKGLIITTLILNILATLLLVGYAVYKTANPPVVNSYQLAMVAGDVSQKFEVEKRSQITVTTLSGQNVIEWSEATNSFSANNVGEVKIEITLPRQNKISVLNVVVYPVGDGSADNPYNVTSASHILRQSEHYTYGKNFILRSDIDLSGYSSWKPIGTLENPFSANFDGNGFSVLNMNIIANEENRLSYVHNSSGEYSVRMGFFGYLKGKDSDNLSTIKNVTIKNASIKTNLLNNYLINNKIELASSWIGVLAGQTNYVTIVGNQNLISANINSSLSNSDENHKIIYGAVAGVVGELKNSTLKGYVVDSKITSSNASFYLADDTDKQTPYGNRISGIVGSLYNSTLENCIVGGKLSSTNFKNAYVSGITTYVRSDSSIKDCVVEDMTFVGNINTLQGADVPHMAIKMSGVTAIVESFEDEMAKIENVSVNNALVLSSEIGQFSGIATTNQGIIKNCSFNGVINAYLASGFVYENAGDILFDDTFTRNAVDTKIYTQTVAAGFFIEHNSGRIIGNPLNPTKVISDITLSVNNLSYNDENPLSTKYISAGFGITANASVENFNVESIINNGYNISGLFAQIMGSETKTFSNISVVSVISTFQGEKESVIIDGEYQIIPVSGMTNNISGIALELNGTNNMFDGVYINININKSIDKNSSFGLNNFGGLFVNSNSGSSASFEDVEIVLDLYSNYASDSTLVLAVYNAGIAYNAGEISLSNGVVASGKIARGESVQYVH